MSRVNLDLWLAYPDDLFDEHAAEKCLRLLSDDERARWEGFKFDKHRREFLATHALARTALSHQRDVPPEALRFRENAYGKPAVDSDDRPHFNLSNSPGLVVCLISDGGEVGVDVEPCERAGSIVEVGPRMFSAKELEQFEALREEDRPRRALQLWTLKEAYAKARGMGLALPMKSFSFIIEDPEVIRFSIDSSLNEVARGWQFGIMQHAGHSIAMVVECTVAPELCVREVRPPTAAPLRLTLPPVHWFPGE